MLLVWDLDEREWNPDHHPRDHRGRFRGKGSDTPAAPSKATPARAGARSGAPTSRAKKPSSPSPGTKATGPSTGGTPPAGAPARDKEWLNGHYSGWRDDLTPAQDKALRFYQSPGFALMNGQLRGLDKDQIKADVSFNDADLARARKASRDLKAAIKNAPPLEEPMTVYRGFSADQFGDLKPGAKITDKGFVSTSITPDVGAVGKASKQATAEIVLPKGAKAAAGSSRELVLPPGSKFKVVDVTTRKGVPHVRMELIV